MGKLLKVALASLDQSTQMSADARKVTYDEGEGKKDLIVMTGPLSSIYTQALNVYFAKTDVNDADVESDSASLAVESAAIDTVITNALIDKIQRDTLFNDYNIVSDREDITQNPNAVVFSTDFGNANKPEVIEIAETENARYQDSGKDWVIFIGPSTTGTGEMELQSFGPDGTGEEINAFNAGDQFKRATEALYTSRGIKVVVGFENLAQWLKTRSKTK